MANIQPQPAKVSELSRLVEVEETRQQLSELCPVWVRCDTVYAGPVIPHPERHPYCEVGITCAGRGTFFVEREVADFRAGDVLLIGTGVPHWGTITRFPYSVITVYFLPSVLIDLGPESDGPAVLHRFTARQTLRERLVRPPPALQRRFRECFTELAAEFAGAEFGREIRLRTLLVEPLVALLRWELKSGRAAADRGFEVEWRPVSRALEHLREHYAEPVYARDVARAAGLSESRLKVLFHNALGMSWVKYLQGYRIHRAAALLSQPGANVTEAALAVGFESLSHFNTVFHAFMGVSPRVYARSAASAAGKDPGMRRGG